MDSVFSKVGLFLATLLASLDGSSYILLDKAELNLAWNNGDISPIYSSVDLTNKGNQKMRFELSSSHNWVDMHREGQPGVRVFNINSNAIVKVIIEIHPNSVSNGSNQATITFKAVNDLDSVVAETKEFKVNLKKNYVEPAPTATVSVSQTPLPSESAAPSPSPTIKNVPSNSPWVQPSSSPTGQPAIYNTPYRTPKILPSADPAQIQEDQEGKSFWDFIKGIFSLFGFGD